MVVDDEILIADGLKEMLSRETNGEVQVQACYSGAEALEIMKKQQMDVLMTDINMPDFSGLELHSRMTATQPDCRVIYLTGYSEFEYAREALDQHAFAYILKGEGDDTIIQTVNRALMETHRPHESAYADSHSASRPQPRFNQQEITGMPWIQQLMKYIEEHLAQDISLQQLADYMHLHPVYLSRAFKEATGKTVGDYIAAVRLERAKELLSGSRMPLQDIAMKTGFTSTNYFCRWFRKETHLTPKTYRDKSYNPS